MNTNRTPIPNLDELARLYIAGAPVARLAPSANVSAHMLRRRFVELGIMRDKATAVRLAFASGAMANRRTRAGVPQSAEARAKQSATMLRKADITARGWRITSSGYVEYTRGEHAGRSFHVVAMEARIGRPLKPDEVVHHIDGNRQNNAENNLALMTRAAHARLHRREDEMSGNTRSRNSRGQYEGKSVCKES